MPYAQRTVRSGNLNGPASNSRGINQPGPSRNVLPPASSLTVQQVVDSDPLGDCGEEEYDLMDVLDSLNTGDSVQVEDFKEEEYELEEYVVLDQSDTADAAPKPKRVRFDSNTSTGTSLTGQLPTSGRATPSAKRVVVQGSQIAGIAGVPALKQLPSASQSAAKTSQVRVVPTERLRMAPTTSSYSVNTRAASSVVTANSFTVPPEKKMTVQYAPLGATTGSPVSQVNQNVTNGPKLPPLQGYGTKQLHVKIVPLNMLNNSQIQQLKAPLAGIASAVKGNPLATNALQPARKPQPAMSISVVPTTPNNSSPSQGNSLSTNAINRMPPLETSSLKPSVDPLAPSPMNPTVVQLNNSSFTITRVVPPDQETEETCTVELDTLDNKQSMLQEDPLATGPEPPPLVRQSSIVPILQPFTCITPGDPLALASEPPVSVQQGSTSHTVSRMIPIRQPISSITSADPLATSSLPPTVVKLMNTSLTVTRIADQSAVKRDPLATGSELPVAPPRPISTSLTVTRIIPTVTQNGPQNGVNVGASTSTKPPPVLLKKPNVTVTKIVSSNVPKGTTPAEAAAPVKTPTVAARTTSQQQRPMSNVQSIRKKCDCRVEIAKRLKLLDERTRQMEAYMNDLIDLIQPETDFEVNPITSRDELERLNYDLGSSPQYLQKVKTWLERRINSRDSHWRMMDAMNILFDNAFLMTCSWKNPSKLPLHSYTYMIELFKFIGTTPQVKVTIVCVGNFFMKQIKSLMKKEKRISHGSTSKDANNGEDASNEEQATNEEAATNEQDATNPEANAVIQQDTSIQNETTGVKGASNQKDTTVANQSSIEQDVNSQEEEEYLEDEYLEDPTYQDDSQTTASDN